MAGGSQGVVRIDTIPKASGTAYKSVHGGWRSTETKRQWTAARRYEAIVLHVNSLDRVMWLVIAGECTVATD